ncbi:hypothetical protein QL285_033989 [Trifolium repens]|nr:hypothetical protein QL285_033989 [Trifolium repens]
MRHADTQTVASAQSGASGSQVQESQAVAQSSAQIGAQTSTQTTAVSSAQIGTQTSVETGTQSGVANTSNPKKGAKRGRKKKNDDAMGTQHSTKKP